MDLKIILMIYYLSSNKIVALTPDLSGEILDPNTEWPIACQDVKDYDKERPEVALKLTFSNVTNLEDGQRQFSNSFCVRNLPWSIFIKTENGTNNHKRCLGAFVAMDWGSDRPTWRANVELTVGLTSLNDNGSFLPVTTQQTVTQGFASGLDCIILWENLTDPANGYIEDDEIQVEVTLKVDSPWTYNSTSNIEENGQFRYDYVYIKDVDGWFKFHRVPATWDDARLQCHLEGAVLASPTNIKMRTVMTNAIKNSENNLGIFVGVHDLFSKGHFLSVEGVPLLRMPVTWMPGEPNNKGNEEQCIQLSSHGTVADVNCRDVFPFICVKKNVNVIYNADCGTTVREYKLEEITGSCYKFHNLLITWPQAFQVCTAEGGHLAVINSAEEAKLLHDLFEINYESVNWKRRSKKVIFLGFYKWSEIGIWSTIHGSPLEGAGYKTWRQKPRSFEFNSVSSYGVMQINGSLDRVEYFYKAPFICEKTPELGDKM